jgi:hypothetical protein
MQGREVVCSLCHVGLILSKKEMVEEETTFMEL